MSDNDKTVPFENTTSINLINLLYVFLFCPFYFIASAGELIRQLANGIVKIYSSKCTLDSMDILVYTRQQGRAVVHQQSSQLTLVTSSYMSHRILRYDCGFSVTAEWLLTQQHCSSQVFDTLMLYQVNTLREAKR